MGAALLDVGDELLALDHVAGVAPQVRESLDRTVLTWDVGIDVTGSDEALPALVGQVRADVLPRVRTALADVTGAEVYLAGSAMNVDMTDWMNGRLPGCTGLPHGRAVPCGSTYAGGMEALLTVGHGTLDRVGLGNLLVDAGVGQLVDVRRFPGSRHNPDSRREALEGWLPGRGVGYRWEERLGGRKRLTKEEDASSPDQWWRVAQFRAYAAGTRTPQYAEAVRELLAGAQRERTVIMCSEAVWWRCHRRIVADVVTLLHDVPVSHLMHDGRLTEHPVSEGARRREDGVVVWDGG